MHIKNTASLTITHLGLVGGKIDTVTRTITSGWTSGVSIGDTNVIATETRSIDSVYNMIFRGESNDFPMRCPIVITATDDAREWDYYDPPVWDDNKDDYDNWTEGRCVDGDSAPNTRTFSTSVPVFGSQLDIRVLDKTIRNE